MSDLRVWIPFLPPSSNKIYEPVWVQGKPRGKRLTQEARKFKIRAMKVIQKEGRGALLNLKEDVPYVLTIAVFFEKIYNKGWPGKAERRYKKVDTTNRVKLIEDTAADGVGVDDRHNFRIILEKHCDPDNPGLYVILRRVPEEEVGLTKEDYDSLQLRRSESHRAGGASPPERGTVGASGDRSGGSDRPAGGTEGSFRFLRRPSRRRA
jgi:hypothetical protein